jgi:hypothetical protein
VNGFHIIPVLSNPGWDIQSGVRIIFGIYTLKFFAIRILEDGLFYGTFAFYR